MKTCSTCRESKDESQFYKDRTKGDGLNTSCKQCSSAYHKRWRTKPGATEIEREAARRYTKKVWRERSLRRLGITIEEFESMGRLQGGRCAICGSKPKVLCVDHDHTSGRVRGLLCHQCNVGLGNFGDDTDRMARAIEYLKLTRV